MKIAMIMMPSWNVETPPMATAYLSAYLKSKNHEVSIFDFNIDLYTNTPKEKQHFFDGNEFNFWHPESNFNSVILKNLEVGKFIQIWAGRIMDSGSGIVCFSTYYSNYLPSLMLAQEIKKRARDKIIVFGGPEADRYEKGYEFLKNDYVDIVVIGEGERVLENIVRAVHNGSGIRSVKGILFKEGDKFFDNGGGEIEDINKIPFPTFEGFNLLNYSGKDILPILASRGCVNCCKFCSSWPFWKYRCRKAESVFEEIRYLKKIYNIKKFDIIDASINGDIEQLDKFCSLLLREKMDIHWGGKACVRPEMSRDFLKKMYSAGCRWLSYGIESGSGKILKAMGKNFSAKLAERVIKDTYKAEINVATFFIIGFPGETKFDFINTLWFIIKNKRYIGSISSGQKCGISKNSILYREAEKYGIKFMDDGWHSRRNTPKERELRHGIFKAVTKFISLDVLHT